MRISNLFSDNMILQRNKPNHLRGESEAFEYISAEINNINVSSRANSEGKFELMLPVFDAGGPYTLTVKGEKDKYVINNVLFGDVFLLGGQSNMELSIGMIPDRNRETLQIDEKPYIRMFDVPKEYDFSGKERMITQGKWQIADSSSIAGFSAIGFYFAEEKYAKDKIPVGLMQTAVGGAPIEALMSEKALLDAKEAIMNKYSLNGECDNNKNMGCIYCYEKLLSKVKTPGFIERTELDDTLRLEKWHKELDDNDPGLRNNYMDDIFDESNSKMISVPGFFLDSEYEDYKGSLWLQKTLCLTKEDLLFIEKSDAPCILSLGTLVDFDYSYLNGQLVGSTDYKYPPRRYAVNKEILKEGINTVTVRLGMDANVGGFIPDMPYRLCLGDREFDISGEWRVRKGKRMDSLEGPTFFIWNPTALFNSMISPLKGLSFEAVLFYQGESNCGHSEYYTDLHLKLIEEWRTLFGKDIPFIIGELAYYLGDGPVYDSDPFAGVRKKQHETASLVENVYLAKISELGQYNELHPQNKLETAHVFFEEYEEYKRTVSAFTKIGISKEESDKRLEDIFNSLFYGNEDERIYYESSDDMSYIVDTGNIDVRTEGMSYGMMMCVQMNKQKEFDRLWKWAKTYMYIDKGPNSGFFAWSCMLDGTKNAYGAAPDGEEYFALALIFAANRFGNREGIFNYSIQAKELLHNMIHKGENGEEGQPMFDRNNKLIKFICEVDFTDPSYHLPHFYELYSQYAYDEDKSFFSEAAKASREYLKHAMNSETGLSAEYAYYNGNPCTEYQDIFGRHDWYYSDAYRTIMNVCLDYYWGSNDEWEKKIAQTFAEFFVNKAGVDNFDHIFLTDGTMLEDKVLHPVAVIASNAMTARILNSKEALTCLELFYNTPLRTGNRRYYDNCLYFFAYLALSGNYRIYKDNDNAKIH